MANIGTFKLEFNTRGRGKKKKEELKRKSVSGAALRKARRRQAGKVGVKGLRPATVAPSGARGFGAGAPSGVAATPVSANGGVSGATLRRRRKLGEEQQLFDRNTADAGSVSGATLRRRRRQGPSFLGPEAAAPEAAPASGATLRRRRDEAVDQRQSERLRGRDAVSGAALRGGRRENETFDRNAAGRAQRRAQAATDLPTPLQSIIRGSIGTLKERSAPIRKFLKDAVTGKHFSGTGNPLATPRPGEGVSALDALREAPGVIKQNVGESASFLGDALTGKHFGEPNAGFSAVDVIKGIPGALRGKPQGAPAAAPGVQAGTDATGQPSVNSSGATQGVEGLGGDQFKTITLPSGGQARVPVATADRLQQQQQGPQFAPRGGDRSGLARRALSNVIGRERDAETARRESREERLEALKTRSLEDVGSVEQRLENRRLKEGRTDRLSESQAEREKQIEAVGLQTQGAIGAAQAKSAGEQLDRDVKTSIAEGKNAADAANGIIDKGKPMRDAQGNPVLDMEGNPVMESYTPEEAIAIQDQVSRASRERELDPVASGRDIGQGAGLNPSTGQTVGAQADAMGTGAAFDADQSGDFSPTEAKKAASWSENTLNEFAKLSPEQQARAKNGPAYREAIAIKKRLDKLASDRVRGTVG